MEAKEYMKELRRMLDTFGRTGGYCDGVDCNKCPLDALNDKDCFTEKAVDIVEQWSKEHPKRTYLDVLLEVFPNTLMSPYGVPSHVCPNHIGLTAPDEDISEYCDYDDCTGCWNREYKEDK